MQTDTTALDLANVDYSALTRPVSKAEVRAFRAQTRAAQRADPTISTGFATATSIITIIALVCFVGIFVAIFSLFAVGAIGAAISDGNVDLGTLSLGLVALLIFGGFAAIMARGILRTDGRWLLLTRVSGFARANGLRFRGGSPDPGYPGCIFNLGDSRRSYDHLTTVAGRFLDFGNYEYWTGSDKNRQVHQWGFLAMNLDRNLPNIVLDSKANNGLFGGTNLPTSFSRKQVLSLEGDFDKHFTLYCPKEYEQDALYIFTPDLMALLIDDASPFDVEIIDNWLFLYSSTPLPLASAANYQRILRIVQTVGAKAVKQTEHYRDERVGSPGADIVAPQGRRLRRGVSVGSLVLLGVFVALWIVSLFHGAQ